MNIFKQFTTIQIGQYRNPNCKAKNTPKRKEMKYEVFSNGDGTYTGFKNGKPVLNFDSLNVAMNWLNRKRL